MNAEADISKNKVKHIMPSAHITPAKRGDMFEIGDGFTALAFKEKSFYGAMDPLVMVDHYRMTKPTFGAHPHAGLSAVSVLFEDSAGEFHNRDSLGNDFDLMPGDLYWLKAGSGVIHDESPRPGSHIHGLQVFVNLGNAERKSKPESLHVKAQSIPVYQENGSRVRIILGESKGIKGKQSPARPMTLLDATLQANKDFQHRLGRKENAWLYAIKGDLKVSIAGQEMTLFSGQSIAVSQLLGISEQEIKIDNQENTPAHFVLFAAEPLNEEFVQKGPFIMRSELEIEQVKAEFDAGKHGHLA